MNAVPKSSVDSAEVRVDFVPRENYVSPEFTKLEETKLWQRVWQVACREEDVPKVGSFFTYNVVGQSIIVVRAEDGNIKAFHNSCRHRGRQLTQGCGSVTKLHCPFHGWQWNLSGDIQYVQDRANWDGYPDMSDPELRLINVRVGIWGGFVFVNMDPNAEPLEEFVQPVSHYLDFLEFGKMRYAWHKTMVVKANWKTALESFMESYHVASTHPQLLTFADETNVSRARGKHGVHIYSWPRPLGSPALRTGKPEPEDFREAYVKAFELLAVQTGGAQRDGSVSDRSAKAVRRLLTEVVPGASQQEIMGKAFEFMKEAAEAEGAGWPTFTAEQAADMGAAWNVFPNMALALGIDCTLVLRTLPNGADPNSCIFDMSAINRYGPGKEPRFEREFYADWRANLDKIPYILAQDVSNMEFVQAGMQSITYRGSRINPAQETQISNLHRVVREYLSRP